MRAPIALALALSLMLSAAAAWGRDGQPGNASFRVTWQPGTQGVTPRIHGRVHNDSRFRVTDVRLKVDGIDAAGQLVGETFTWALGDIDPGGETSFVADGVRGAVTYRVAVDSFDVVSGEQSP